MIEQAEKIEETKPKKARGPNKPKEVSEDRLGTRSFEDLDLATAINRVGDNLAKLPGLLAYDIGFIVGRTISLYKENKGLKEELEAFR